MIACLRRSILCSLGFFLIAQLAGVPGAAQTPLRSITYRLSMSRPLSHLFEVKIEVELPDDLKDKAIEFQMARWSPGRYAVFDFAKNVQEFTAVAGTCPPSTTCELPKRAVTRLDDQTWSVAPLGSSSLTISYKVFGNDLSGTFSQLNEKHANFNGGCIFLYIVGHKADPVTLSINAPQGWKIVNGRMSKMGQTEWQFPNWDIMIDTPMEIAADWTLDTFEVDGKRYHVVVHSLGDEANKRALLVRDIEKVVRAETAMWGRPEFNQYTFLLHFAADDHSGDGMEHLTSTQIIEPGALADPGMYDDTLDAVAHEFFHLWNVKRLRPFELGPWDFTRPVSTHGLWVAEGFTNYYGHLMLRRAGIWDDTRFLRREAQTITGIERAPGSRLMSAEESSLIAPFIDDAPHAQATNLDNTAISYYPKGELIGMVMDLIVRGRSKGKASLDDILRHMYDEFYVKSAKNSYYLNGRGYHTEDVQRVGSEIAGFSLEDFFNRYIRDVEVLPYDEAFSYVGLRVNRVLSKEPFNAGLSLHFDVPEEPVIESVRNNSPAEEAGLQSGDELVSIGGKPATKDSWLQTFARYKSGDSVAVVVRRDRRTIKGSIVLGEPDRFEYRIEERPDATAEQKALRAQWLNGR
jgi:predicted metalloprotease with PDZ domain